MHVIHFMEVTFLHCLSLTTNDDYSCHRDSGGVWVGVTICMTVHGSCQCQVGHSISGIVGGFQSRGAFSGRRALSIEC